MAKRKTPKTNIGVSDLRKLEKETLDFKKRINKERNISIQLEIDELSGLRNIFNLKKRELEAQKNVNNELDKLIAKQQAYKTGSETGLRIATRTRNLWKENEEMQEVAYIASERRLKSAKNINKTLKNINILLGSNAWARSGVWKYLLESDKVIRQTNLELGLSGEKADLLRESFLATTTFANRLGISVKNIALIQKTFTDETGRARVLTTEMLEDIILIGAGTGLGVKNAAGLVAQFDLMGVNTNKSLQFSQDIVETSERMGVNVTKVMSNISKNFKTLQKFTFQKGVKGFAEMATYAEKFKVDMGQMLDSAEKARTLEGAVKLAANLQVMGGEFAKTDPFELLFLSRNDPAAYTKKINEMTKGIVTWKKNADGSFEKFISPADRDRLEAVGKTLGLQSGELITQSLRMADITQMRRQMLGIGVNKQQRELIEGMAQLSDNGQFTITVGDEIKNLSQLTSNDIDALEQQSKTLEQRAIDSQTFMDTLKNTTDMLKSTLLPMLKGINMVLSKLVKGANWMKETLPGWSKVANTILTGAGVLMASGVLLSSIFRGFSSIKSMVGRGRMKGVRGMGGMAKGVGGAATAGRGGSTLAGGVGVGVGALGIGGGMLMASIGISSIAEAMKGMDAEQLAALKWISTVMPIAMGVGAALMVIFGKAAEISAIGIGILTLAFLGIGAGIGLATAGIGFMAKGLASLAQPEIVSNLYGVAGGVLALMGAMAIGGVAGFLGTAGMLATVASVTGIASQADNMERVGTAFGNIAIVMNGNISQLKEIQEIIASISNTKMGSNNVFTQLSNLLNKPLKVEFDKKEVAMSVELNMDGSTVFKKIFDANVSARKYTDARNGILTST